MTETIVPHCGWVCYFCGEVCKTVEEANHHFGMDEYEYEMPACLQLLTYGEKALRSDLIKMHEEWMKWQMEATEADSKLAMHDRLMAELEKHFGIRTAGDVYMKWESLNNRIRTLEAVLEYLRRRGKKEAVEIATEMVCKLGFEPFEQPEEASSNGKSKSTSKEVEADDQTAPGAARGGEAAARSSCEDPERGGSSQSSNNRGQE